MKSHKKSISTQGRVEGSPEKINLMLAIGGLGLGGAEMVVRDLARNLDSSRFKLSICCTKGIGNEIDGELLDDGFDVFCLQRKQDEKTDYFSALKLWRAVKERQVDILHTHATTALFDAAPCRIVRPGMKLAHTFHYGNYPFDSWRHHNLEYLSARAADRLIAVGHEQSERVQETYRLPKSRLQTIWNGVTVDSQSARTSFRAEIGTGNRLLIGTIAKLIEQKGLDDLLSVAKLCKDSDLPFQFVIIGDGPLRHELEQRIHELGIDDMVVMTGWVHNAAATVLPEFDVFFQPSRWEAMSIVILEAMAAKKAIVATGVGDNAHVLEHDESGLLVSSGDIPGMSQALARLNNEALRAKLGNAARIRYEEKFTVRRMVDRYERLYLELDSER